MSNPLAFSTVACPEWTIDEVAERAAGMGYAGVELRTLGPGGGGLASDPAQTDADKTRAALQKHQVAAVCLSTSVSLHHRDTSAAGQARWQAMHSLELAAKIGCGFVRVFGNEIAPGEDHQVVTRRIVEQLRPMAERAAELGVGLLIENAGSFATAKQWWWLLNLVDQPGVGISWNAANAAAAGEPASVSVPMLNSRIRLAKVKDTRVGEGAGFVPLGEGTVGIEAFVKRLLGIGYGGYICVEWDRLWFPSLAPAEEYLPDAHERVTGWLKGIAALEEKGRAANEKAAAKNAPKPRAKPAA